MKIMTKRLVLRGPTLRDLKDIAENAHDKEVNKYTLVPYPYKIKDAREFVLEYKKTSKKKKRERYEFGITLKSDGKVMGLIGLSNVNERDKKAVIGYWLGKEHRRKGILSEAEKAVLNFAFYKLKLSKISGRVDTDNKASIKLFKKFGFRKVGVMKSDVIVNGEWKDVYLWELLKENYKK